MAQTYTKDKLSGSTNGRGIKVAATASAGTLIHTSTSSAVGRDEIWLWAVNTTTTNKKLTIEMGGTTSPDDLIEQTIPPESGLVSIIPGLVLNNGAVVRAFAETADVIVIHGFINNIT